MAEPSEDELFCSSCGEPIRRSVNFCRHCGEPNRHGDKAGWGPAEDTGNHGRSGAVADGRVQDRPEPYGPRAAAEDRHDEGDSWGQTRRGVPDDDRRRESSVDASGDDNPWRRQFPPSRTDGSARRVVAGAVGIGLAGFLLMQIVALTALAPAVAAGFSATSAAVQLFGTAVGQIVAFVGFGLWYLRRRGLDWEGVKSYLGVRRPGLRDAGIILGGTLAVLLGSAVVGIAATAADEAFELTDPDDTVGAEQEVVTMLTDNPELIPVAVLLMFLVVGPAEELLFRGVVQARMRERVSALPAILLTSVVFALIHIPGFALGSSLFDVVTGVSVLAIGSIIFGYVYERTQNIVVVALLHGFYNSVVLMFAYVAEVSDVEPAILAVLTVLPV